MADCSHGTLYVTASSRGHARSNKQRLRKARKPETRLTAGSGLKSPYKPLSDNEVIATGSGHFPGAEQTMSLMETEFDYLELAYRDNPQDWLDGGSASMWGRACDKTAIMLDNHRPYYIERNTDKWLRNNYPVILNV